MSSPYVVLENRSLDQWKVTELKEQLKRRNLTTKGLKDDLVKRLDQALRSEDNLTPHHNGVNQTTNIRDGNNAVTQSLGEDIKITDKLNGIESPNAKPINIFNKNDSEDVGSPEKLNLDRTSGDDSMEEDFTSQHIGDINEKTQVPLFKEGEPLDVMAEDIPAAKNDESAKDTSDAAAVSTKRKLNEQEAVTNSEVVKRQRRWNSQGLNIPEQQNTRPSVSTTPKGGFQASLKHSFSRSNSFVSQEEPKERVVPPSLKDPTNSLRIDRFLRPFTLKAVQELLGKTGTVVSFWMDHIKTHCYVTYLSVDEAVETRNAVYNLQWPANGGRLLVAEFVDQSEVKSRTDAPLPSPVTPVATTPTFPKQPPAATHTFPKQPPAVTHIFPKQTPAVAQPPQQQLPPPPPLPLPPPPQLSYPPTLREAALPPPPPHPEKLKPPIVTLDDLFGKTRATPRIYYLPLSEEQVAAKLKGQGRNANRISM